MRKLSKQSLQDWKKITKKQKNIETKIVNKICEYLTSKDMMHINSCYWFKDAEQGQIGTLSSSVKGNTITLYYMENYKVGVEQEVNISISDLFTQ